ncbi:hypothetical protein D8Y22_07515 [Salinadaptatus halalkaliphilus]|uniref:Uncharacterized protein n=1 Tax=Salinadaptatus halalkaliphilus TaxID=2419781 RepID=A0A4V3VLC1_9EURY|nr:hypothetical protein D8Y22_07515 [Salinadaptatus halalkaliphilus]
MTDRPESTTRPHSPGSTLDPESGRVPIREQLRRWLGVSRRQWEWLVSAVIVGPYVLAVALLAGGRFAESWILFAIGIHSGIALYLSYKF